MCSYTRPTISVVVVNFNAGGLLELCIDRIRQSTTPVELIVVDNHSKDVSKVWALGCKGWPTEKYIQNDQNLGFSAAVNIGATVASGEILVVINPDCLVWPHTIDRLCSFLNDQKQVGLVGGLVFGIDGREQNGCRRYDVTPIRSIGKMLGKLFHFKNFPTIDMTRESIPRSSIDVDAVSGSFFAVRKSIYNELGGFDEDYFLHFEDLDFCRRVRRAGYRVVFNPDVSAVHVGAMSSRVKSVQIVRYKHRSIKVYFRKFLNRYSLAVCLVLMMSQLYVWLRDLYEFIKPEQGYDNRSDRFGGIWDATNVNDVFVTGDQCRLLHSIVMRLAARGYNVVVETSDPQLAPKIPQVSWVASEYRGKVPEKDYREFAREICIGSIEQLLDYQRNCARQNVGSQLMIETGVPTNVVKQSSTIERFVGMEKSMDWLQRASVCFRFRSSSSGRGELDYQPKFNKIEGSQCLHIEGGSGVDNHQNVHVDDISELCLDVLFGISEEKSEQNTQQILKNAIDRFNRRIRPLYN